MNAAINQAMARVRVQLLFNLLQPFNLLQSTMKSSFNLSCNSILLVSGVLLASMALAAGPKPATADAEFTKMDTNKDGKVSADEHTAASKRMFDTMDANHDGKVTAAEMAAAHQRVTGKKAQKSDMSAADKIKAVDTDGDGILTAAEHAAGSRTMFEKMDTDKDGFLTKVELTAGHASMMKPGAAQGAVAGTSVPPANSVMAPSSRPASSPTATRSNTEMTRAEESAAMPMAGQNNDHSAPVAAAKGASAP